MLKDFLFAVPKVDLHLHLVGSASPTTVAQLAARSPHVGVPIDLDSIRRYFEFRDFPHFIDVYTTERARTSLTSLTAQRPISRHRTPRTRN
jgi:adenosine deaminase